MEKFAVKLISKVEFKAKLILQLQFRKRQFERSSFLDSFMRRKSLISERKSTKFAELRLLNPTVRLMNICKIFNLRNQIMTR